MTIRKIRLECERFSSRLFSQGAQPYHIAGLMLGAFMRVVRDNGMMTRNEYLAACAMIWDNNNPPDLPIDAEVKS